MWQVNYCVTQTRFSLSQLSIGENFKYSLSFYSLLQLKHLQRPQRESQQQEQFCTLIVAFSAFHLFNLYCHCWQSIPSFKYDYIFSNPVLKHWQKLKHTISAWAHIFVPHRCQPWPRPWPDMRASGTCCIGPSSPTRLHLRLSRSSGHHPLFQQEHAPVLFSMHTSTWGPH